MCLTISGPGWMEISRISCFEDEKHPRLVSGGGVLAPVSLRYDALGKQIVLAKPADGGVLVEGVAEVQKGGFLRGVLQDFAQDGRREGTGIGAGAGEGDFPDTVLAQDVFQLLGEKGIGDGPGGTACFVFGNFAAVAQQAGVQELGAG